MILLEFFTKNSPYMKREEANKHYHHFLWLSVHCPKCENNLDRGTEYVNCQAECEVAKTDGIACIHYEEYIEVEE